jgi:hypothetical protein
MIKTYGERDAFCNYCNKERTVNSVMLRSKWQYSKCDRILYENECKVCGSQWLEIYFNDDHQKDYIVELFTPRVGF